MSWRPRALAFVGGTGKEGRGLALRCAAAKHPVLIGSRSTERAESAAADLRTRLRGRGHPAGSVDVLRGYAALSEADVVFLTVPFSGLPPFLEEWGGALAGKIVVDVVVPLRVVDGRFELQPPAEGSVTALVQRRVPAARVVAGFKNLAAADLLAVGNTLEGDVLLAAEDQDAKTAVASLVHDIPNLRPLDAGPLVNAGFLESLTALELNLNRLHNARTTIRILGIEQPFGKRNP